MKKSLFHVFLACFDVSADHHALTLIKALLHEFSDLAFSVFGGEELFHYSQEEKRIRYLGDMSTASSIGLFEGFHQLRKSFGFFRECYRFMKTDHENFGRVDLFFAIDGQGRNLLLGKKAHALGIQTAYFFPPNVYVWGRWNIKKMRIFDAVFCAFEKNYHLYKNGGVSAHLAGHPFVYYKKNLTERKEAAREKWRLPKKAILVSFFPGSRFQELEHLAPLFFQVAKALKRRFSQPQNLYFLCSLAHENFRSMVELAREKAGLSETELPIVSSSYDDILLSSQFSLLCSGTVTLKAAFFGLPHVVAYKISTISYLLAKMLMHVKYISMHNIIANKAVNKEFINAQLNVANLLEEALFWIENKEALASKENELLQLSDGLYGQDPFAVIADVLKAMMKKSQYQKKEGSFR